MRLKILATLAIVALAASIEAQQGRKVSGTVLAASNRQPVAGATVQYDEGRRSETTTTDSKGYFEFARRYPRCRHSLREQLRDCPAAVAASYRRTTEDPPHSAYNSPGHRNRHGDSQSNGGCCCLRDHP